MEFLGSVTAFLAFLLGFGFLVFVHELGHFLVAKWVGIKCTQFAIGFGPSIFAWRKGLGVRTGSTEAEYERRLREHFQQQLIDPDAATPAQIDRATVALGLGETEYRLNYVPLGGYVKMLGQEDLDPAARSNDPRSLNAKPVWARACVFSAGVVMNVIFGFLFFIVAFMSGVEFPSTTVGRVEPTMPAAQAYAQGHEGEPAYRGLQVGDRITAIDGEAIGDWMEVRIATALGAPGEAVVMTVQRPGVDQPLRYRMTPVPSPRDKLLSVGVSPAFDIGHVVGVLESSAAHEAGVRGGWQLVAVEGEPVSAYYTYHRAMMRDPGEPVSVTFADPDAQQRATVALSAEPVLQPPIAEDEGEDEGPTHLAGLVPATRVTFVVADSAAASVGLKPGDVIVQLGDARWPTPSALVEVVQDARDALALVVLRDGERVELEPVEPRGGQIGVGMSLATALPIVSGTRSASPAASLDLTGGSRILELNGEAVSSWGDMQRVLASLEAPAAGEQREVAIAYELNIAGQPREEATLSLSAAEVEALQQTMWDVPSSVMFDVLRKPVVAANPWDAAVLGVEKTGQFIAQTYLTIVRLVQGTVQVEHLRGPVGIVDEGTRITQAGGWQYLVFFLGLISVNLAVINFLPIPIVDGGHMLFLIVEKLKGSPVSVGVQTAATYVGLALIAALFVTLTLYDVLRLVTGGP